MTRVAARELRNDTAGVLRRVRAGEEVIVTVRGEPVARLVPVVAEPEGGMSRQDLCEVLRTASADDGLRADLERLAGQTTDDLGPVG